MTETLRTTQPSKTVESFAATRTIAQMIDASLARIEKLSDDEAERQLANLIVCAGHINLRDYVKANRVEEFEEAVPNVMDFIKKIHDLADLVLHTETLDADSVTVIVDLGAAADITGDKELLEQTLDAIEDTNDMNLASIVKAMTIAHDEERMFTDVYLDMKAGGSTVAAAARYVQMHDRPDFRPDDEYAHLLSHRNFALAEGRPTSVAINSYEDIFDGTKPHAAISNNTEFKLYEKSLDGDFHSVLSSNEVNKRD